MKILKSLVAAVIVLTPVPIISAEPNVENFRVGLVELSMPIPSGYCVPKGQSAAVAQLLAAADPENITHTSLFNCDDTKGEYDYILVKTPKSALLAEMERVPFLEAMRDAFASDVTKAQIASKEIETAVSGNFEKILNVKIGMDSAVVPRGQDDACMYIGGYVSYKDVPEPYTIALGLCMTTVANKMVSVAIYAPPKDDQDVAKLMAQARAIALSMQSVQAK